MSGNDRISILGIGIATMDIYCHQNKMYPGGNELNIAYNACILGARAAFMGVFANDRVGEILEDTLVRAGVDVSRSHHERGSSGYALVDLADGDRVFLDWNKKGVTDLYPFSFTAEEILYIKGFDVTCISRGARVSADKIRMLSEKGAIICYDFYDNFTNDDISSIAPCIKYAFFSCSHISAEETMQVLKEAVELGAALAVGTRGGEAAIAYDGRDYILQPVKKVKPTDTMGAGDSFISAFLFYYLSGGKENGDAHEIIRTALEKASEYAATVVQKDGSLGIGYDVDPSDLGRIINLKQEV